MPDSNFIAYIRSHEAWRCILRRRAFSFPSNISEVRLFSNGLKISSRSASGEMSIIRHCNLSLSSMVSYIAWLTSDILNYDARSLMFCLKKLRSHVTPFHWSRMLSRTLSRQLSYLTAHRVPLSVTRSNYMSYLFCKGTHYFSCKQLKSCFCSYNSTVFVY